MSEIKSESISSLMDDNTSPNDDSVSSHLVDSLLKDKSLCDTWQNYHLIGDVLRDEVPQSLQLDLSDSISAAIAQEATILSPNSSGAPNSPVNNTMNTVEDIDEASALEPQTLAPNTTQQHNVIDVSSRFKVKLNSIVKPLGQVAIAASAAVLMIVGVQNNAVENPVTVTPSQVVQTMPFSGYANPVSFDLKSQQITTDLSIQNQVNTVKPQQMTDEQLIAERIAQQRRLHALLKDHNEQLKIR